MENGVYWKLKGECLPLDVSKHLEENDLDGLLNYEGLLQEIKAENYELINFLSKEENLKKIIKYITEESEDKSSYDKSYKFPYKCHQIINAENKLITDSLVYNDKLMKLFWSFVLKKNQLNEVLSGYFSRCAITIYNKNTTEVVNFLKRKKELYLKGFLYHFYSRNITELFKVLLFVKMPYLCIFDNKDIIYFILSNLNGNFSKETFIICDREDNITCLIRDIFVRKSEIYYFNYFLIDLSSQLSFSYLIKCVFSDCPYTISAAITIISDLLHYSVLGKSYNTIDFYECLDLYTKEQDQKNKQLKQMEEECKYTTRKKKKKKKKRKSNKVIDEEAVYNTSKAHASCVNQVRESDEILMGGTSSNVFDQYGLGATSSVGMPAGFATPPRNYSHEETPPDVDNITEEEKREIEKSELEREKEGKVSGRGVVGKVVTNVSANSGATELSSNFYEVNQPNHVNKKIKEEMQTIGITPQGETDGEKKYNTLHGMTEELSKGEFEPEGDTPFSVQYELHSEEQQHPPHGEDPTGGGVFHSGNLQTGETHNLVGDGVDISNGSGSILSWDPLRGSENNGEQAQNGEDAQNAESLLAQKHAVSYYYSCGDGSQEGRENPDFLIGGHQRNDLAQLPNMHTYGSGTQGEDNNKSNGIIKYVKDAKNERNSDNDNCFSYGSDASSYDSSDDENYDHLKKIKFEDVLNRMKRIASNRVHVKEDGDGGDIISIGKNSLLHRTQSNEKKKIKEDIFGIESNNCRDKVANGSSNEEQNFQIFECEKEGDINIPLNKWVQYLENGTFVDVCFFCYIKDIIKLYIKNINKNKSKNMLGFTTLEIIQLIKTLIKTKSKNILTEIIDEGFFDISIDIFFKYKWNNLLHISVCDLMQTIIFKENEYSYLLYYILALTTFLPKCLRYFDAVRRCRNIKNKKRKKKIESLIDCGYKAHLLHICQILSNKSLEIKWLSNFLVTVSGWNDIIIEELNHYSLYFNDVNYGDEKRAEEADHAEIISNGLCNQADNSMTHHHMNNVGGTTADNREQNLINGDASGNSDRCMNRNYHYEDEEEDDEDHQRGNCNRDHGGNGTTVQSDQHEPARSSDQDGNENCFNNYSNVIDILFDEHKNEYIKYEDEYHDSSANYELPPNCNYGNHDSHAEDMNRLDEGYGKQGEYGLGSYKGGYEAQEGHHKDGHPEGDPFANPSNSYLFDRGDGNPNLGDDHPDLNSGSDPFSQN
ncbi:hypothetical protein AK88_01162 [Plasmodium fragile]|uniref:Protein SOC1 n=1 Tax=Plasmodium fragile TaxID=5857 RepID=A0A0D9QTP5_PLAFR|nr:uncharacterized protein AK88_01162 [Plasmodium fragile]KJP89076.1 hypothetical protein AK88_01162 [Plasmodium fragile]